MATQYETLFSVSFGHEYFGNDVYSGFKISPTAETQNDLLRYGFIFKENLGGFLVFYDSHFQGNLRSRENALKSAISLVFNIINVNANFITFTGGITDNVDLDVSKQIFCFTNQPFGTDGCRNSLQEKDYVGTSEMIHLADYPEKFFSKPFGQIRILLCDSLEKSFKISFAAKSSHWRYLLVSDFLKSLASPAIINKVTGELFIGPDTLQISGMGEVLAFHSAAPIMSTATPNKSFQLVENYEADSGKFRVLFGILPNPIPGSISKLPGLESGEIKFSEIFL